MTTRITTDNITDGQVKTADIADTEVTNGKLASTAVTSSKDGIFSNDTYISI